MTIIAIVSQKGGSGKTTPVNLAAAAEAAGAIALIIDTDPQATASQWGAWRADKAPEVIDSAPPRIQARSRPQKPRRDLHRDRHATPCR
jgi:chromosome partitioning protein